MPDTFREMDPGQVPAKNRILFLMERGAALQAQGAYETSARDSSSAPRRSTGTIYLSFLRSRN